MHATIICWMHVTPPVIQFVIREHNYNQYEENMTCQKLRWFVFSTVIFIRFKLVLYLCHVYVFKYILIHEHKRLYHRKRSLEKDLLQRIWKVNLADLEIQKSKGTGVGSKVSIYINECFLNKLCILN